MISEKIVLYPESNYKLREELLRQINEFYFKGYRTEKTYNKIIDINSEIKIKKLCHKPEDTQVLENELFFIIAEETDTKKELLLSLDELEQFYV